MHTAPSNLAALRVFARERFDQWIVTAEEARRPDVFPAGRQWVERMAAAGTVDALLDVVRELIQDWQQTAMAAAPEHHRAIFAEVDRFTADLLTFQNGGLLERAAGA